MPKKMKDFCRRHKVFTVLSSAIVVFVSLLLIFCLLTINRAYRDTPRVVALATSPSRITLRLEDVPEEYLHILLTVEDPNFYGHHGIDLTTPGAGWTTITQGIVKIYFYNGFTPGTFRYRKFEQSLIACVFDREVDKRTQLLIFINSAYFGELDGKEIIGFQNAAKAYFKKNFPDLTRDEYISLVAMLVGPNEYNVTLQPKKNRERVARIDRLLNGNCRPKGLTDVYYEACAP